MTNSAPAKTTATEMASLLGQSAHAAAGDFGIPLYAWAKFDAKKGLYTYGQGGESVIPSKTKVHVNLATMRVGASCWVKDKSVDTIEDSFWKAKDMLKPERLAMLPDHGPYAETANGKEGWRGYYNIQFIALDTKNEFVCGFSSGGSQRAVKEFIGNVIKAKIQGIDIDNKVPVVVLSTKTSKTNAGYTVTSPVLTIDGWVDKSTVMFSAFTGKTPQNKIAEGDVAESQGEDVTV